MASIQLLQGSHQRRDANDLSIRWVCESGAKPIRVAVDQTELVRTPAPFPDGQGQGWMEMLDLNLGIHVARMVHEFEPGLAGLAPMSEVRTELHEPLLFIQAARTGSGVLVDRRLDRRLVHDPDVCVFQHLDAVDHQHWADTRASIEVTALGVGYFRLEALLGEGTARELLELLGIAALPSARVHPLPRPIKAILESCLADHLTGDLRKLHAQVRVLDFLLAPVRHLQGEVKPEAQTRKQMIHRLREELDQLNGQIPCLDDLARRYGFSARAMNDVFKREFGETLYAYLTHLRLNAAHACLLGGHAPLKVVAARLGYASISQFSHAFNRKFGCRPGSLRRQSMPESDDL